MTAEPTRGPCGAPSGTKILWPTRFDMATALFKQGGVGAELGVLYGDFSVEMIVRVKPKRLFLVDIWEGLEGEFNHAMSRMKNQIQSGQVIVWRNTTDEASLGILPAALDWVYVDADHNYKQVLTDLTLWWPKIKKYGWLCGHDYHLGLPPCRDRPWGVVPAVKQFLMSTPEAEFVGATADASASFAIRHRLNT